MSTTTYDLIVSARTLAVQGEAGFEEDLAYAEWERALADLGATAADKTLARRHVGLTLRDQATRLKALATEIADRARRVEAQADRVDEGTLALVGETLAATGDARLALGDGNWVKAERRQSRAVVVTSEIEIPDEFCRHTTEPDKTKIKAALESGQSVPGAALELRESVGLRWGKQPCPQPLPSPTS